MVHLSSLICIPLIPIFRFSYQKDDLQYALFLTLLFGILFPLKLMKWLTLNYFNFMSFLIFFGILVPYFLNFHMTGIMFSIWSNPKGTMITLMINSKKKDNF